MIYFDTSYLVRLYYQDPGADAVRALAASDHVASAAHGQAEMFAAFHRKLREGAIPPAAYAALLGQVQAHIEAGAFRWLSQDEQVFTRIRHVYRKLPRSVSCAPPMPSTWLRRPSPASRSSIPMTLTCWLPPNISASRERTSFLKPEAKPHES